MPNKVLFQPGLPMLGFFDRFGSERQCEDRLRKSRGPDGFECSACHSNDHGVASG